jgi:citrate lyase beta subunit
MKHQAYNPHFSFVKEPEEFNLKTEKELLQYCLGATLYMPGTKNILDKILNKDMPEITSMVMCFEDAIDEKELETAEFNVITHLEKIYAAVEEGKLSVSEVPLIFLRVRNTTQFRSFAKKMTHKSVRYLSGFVFPKFATDNGAEYLSIFSALSERLEASLYCMPLLEGRAIAYKEFRERELMAIREMVRPFKDRVLNIRIGGTDISSLFGVRRGINYSIYDILTVRDALTDILNFFSRVEDGYVVSGPVWEYFLAHSGDNIDQILEENIHISLLNRNQILNEAIDGLLREVILDKANGFVGKTIIHPSHARFVNAMQAVTREEYDDALQILGNSGGVIKSDKANKMNEINPHRNWAHKIMNRARVFGVVENDLSYLKLILGRNAEGVKVKM